MNTDPVEYPTIMLGGAERQVKFTLSDVIKLHRQGINLFENQPSLPMPEMFERAMKMLVIGAHVDMTWEQAADEIGFNGLKDAMAVLLEGIRKVSAQIRGAESEPKATPLQ